MIESLKYKVKEFYQQKEKKTENRFKKNSKTIKKLIMEKLALKKRGKIRADGEER